MWCIGNLDEEFRTRMYALLDLYALPYDPDQPLIGLDEKSKQLLADTRGSLRGKVRKADYEYKRKGTENIFLAVEPQAGKRTTRVTDRRTRKDFAKFVRFLTDKVYPSASIIHVVLDNLNTHFAKSFYEAFPEKEAKRVLSRIRFHYTPKHGSWLNMAEIEIGIMNRQCLDRRIPTKKMLARELAAWEKERNRRRNKIVWKFTKQDADRKLGKHYY
jgi:hypothetical protein